MIADAVVITGMGAASALGTGIDAHRAALFEGRHGFRAVERFDTSAMSARLAATWPAWDGRAQLEPGRDRDLAATAAPFPLDELALAAAREAWANAGAGGDRKRAALVLGTCFGHGFSEFSPVSERVAAGLAIEGACITLSTACSSSTNAIGLARDLLLHGHADVVVAGGADTLLREAFAGFSALGVLSVEPCAPFSEPAGTTLGEGAGFFVLERAKDAARRGARAWGSIRGYGLSADAFHETTPDPSGGGVARAIRGALLDAGWSARDVDYVSAHATGTENNDRVEWSVIERELGAPLVSGSKGHLGHTQGAAGALELVLALLAHREGCVPPTLHFRGARAGCPADPVASSTPRVAPVARGLKLSAAFGGANAVLAYEREPSPARERARASVIVGGLGVVGPLGAHRLADVLELAATRSAGARREIDLDAFGVDGRRLDRTARALTAAAALALPHARRSPPERTGLFVAGTRMPEESARRCTESIRLRGIGATSASAFARMSVNAPAGACAKALGLLGPTSTFSIGRGTGLFALALAAEWLAWREDAAAMLAGGVDDRLGAPDEAEGAACFLLERGAASDGAIVVAGWGFAGPAALGDAAARAMHGRSKVDALFVDAGAASCEDWLAEGSRFGVLEGDRVWGESEATRSCVLAAIAAGRLAAGELDSAMIVASGATSVAVVLERGRA